MAYLDQTGLAQVWERMKTYLASKAPTAGTKNNLTLTSNFTQYSSSFPAAIYWKHRNRVYVCGIVKPTKDLAQPDYIKAYEYIIGTLPEGYRPPRIVYELCQGSGVRKWFLVIRTNGELVLMRYGFVNEGLNGLVSTTIPSSAWLPFNTSFTL